MDEESECFENEDDWIAELNNADLFYKDFGDDNPWEHVGYSDPNDWETDPTWPYGQYLE